MLKSWLYITKSKISRAKNSQSWRNTTPRKIKQDKWPLMMKWSSRSFVKLQKNKSFRRLTSYAPHASLSWQTLEWFDIQSRLNWRSYTSNITRMPVTNAKISKTNHFSWWPFAAWTSCDMSLGSKSRPEQMSFRKIGPDRTQTDQTASAIPYASKPELLPVKHILRRHTAERNHIKRP